MFGHERGRAADEGGRIGRDGQGDQLVLGEAAVLGVSAAAFLGGGGGVEEVFVGVRQRGEQGVCFGSQRMFRGLRAPWIHQTSRSLRRSASSCSMRQHRREADAGGDEQDRARPVAENEVAAGRRDIEDDAGRSCVVR